MPKYITKRVYDAHMPWPYVTPYGTVTVREVVPTAKKPPPKKETKKCSFQYPPEIAALLSGKPSKRIKPVSPPTSTASRKKPTPHSAPVPNTTA